MGKSDKKVKTDRINALRKQYDSFLEDDKKRKERNEYILEKLDKMRYCTAVVQVRQKVPYFIESQNISLFNMPEHVLNSSSGLSRRNLDKARDRTDEADLLKEISKKYILIPKLRSNYDNDYADQIKPKIDEKIDWRSKYDILDKLKKDEKEQDSSMSQGACLLEPEHNNLLRKYFDEDSIPLHDEPLHEYKNEFPVKLPPEDEIPFELQNYKNGNAVIDPNYLSGPVADSKEHITTNDLAEPMYSESSLRNTMYDKNNDMHVTYDTDSQNVTYDQNKNDNTIYDQIPSKDNSEFSECQGYNDKYDQNESNQIINNDQNTTIAEASTGEFHSPTGNKNDNEQAEPVIFTASQEGCALKEEENNNVIEPDIQIHLQEDTLIHENKSNDMLDETYNKIHPESDTEILGSNIDYPIETLNIQDFTPSDDVQLVDGVNVNPEPQVLISNNDVNQHFDPAVDPENVLPTETLNNEHQEGIYSEQKEHYDYTEEGVAETYDSEYNPPTENYHPNEEYAYYEGAQQEQPYTEINEHEETTQQYDQNYEQQYGTAYDPQTYQQQGYEQEYAQGYDQHDYTNTQEQYETGQQAQQDLHYENQDNLTPQYVEQQLNNEEGYIEDTNVKAEEITGDNLVVETQQIPAATEQEANVQ